MKLKRGRAAAGSVPTGWFTIAEYTYNGLSQRTVKRSIGRNTPSDTATSLTLSERRYFYYDAAWRAIVEEIDDDVGSTTETPTTVPGTDRVAQQFFGLRGLNDAVFRREDRTTPAIAAIEDDPETTEVNEAQAAVPAAGPDGDFDGGHDLRFYQLSDHQLSVVRVLLDVERTNWYPGNDVEYDPYGNPRRTATADFNRSGGISIQDLYDFLSAYFAPHLAADLNGTGAVSLQDLNDFMSEYFGADSTPRDRISGKVLGALIDNPYGYCGYYFDAETAAAKVLGPGGGGLYQCRHRVYDPIAGRWLTEDPAGLVDGSNLYEYCAGDSINCFDPAGLEGHRGMTQDIGACTPDDGQRQRIVKQDRTESWVPDWLEDAAYFTAGFFKNVDDTVNNIAHAAFHPIQTAEAMWEGAKRQAANHAANKGTEVTWWSTFHEFLGNLSGMNDIAAAAYGYDSSEDRILKGWERVAAGLRGFGEAVLTVTGGGWVAGKAATATKVKELRRPYIRKAVRKEVERRAPRGPNGEFLSPNTGRPITGKYHLGHRYGHEFRREKAKAQREGLTQQEFNDRMNNPEFYQIDDPLENMSHRYEKPGND